MFDIITVLAASSKSFKSVLAAAAIGFKFT